MNTCQLNWLLLVCAVGGLLNATFGNATEMIISIYALKSNMIRVVQQSLLGSILSNMLLVLGCAFFTGGIAHYKKVQVFDKVRFMTLVKISARNFFFVFCLLLPSRTSHFSLPLQQAAAVVNSGLLLMAVMGILFPAVLYFTHSEVHQGKSVLSLSRFSSCIMLVAYAGYLFFQLRSQQNVYSPVNEVSSFAPFLKTFLLFLSCLWCIIIMTCTMWCGWGETRLCFFIVVFLMRIRCVVAIRYFEFSTI